MTDVRAFDPIDSEFPDQDLIAIYTRDISGDLQLRLDFLDLPTEPALDIYLAIDYLPGGTSILPLSQSADILWDTMTYIPASGLIQTQSANLKTISDVSVFAERNPILDFIEIVIKQENRSVVRGKVTLQVFITPPGSNVISDQSNSIRHIDLPLKPASVLLAFWDTMPADSPAQSIRHWNGAHTGPLGGRHGLYNLLRASRSNEIPITLLDIKIPETLSALDYVGALNLIRAMQSENLLVIPDVNMTSQSQFPSLIQDNVDSTPERYIQSITEGFGFPPSPFASYYYSPTENLNHLTSNHPVVFIPAEAHSSKNEIHQPVFIDIYRWGNSHIIPLPGMGQPTNGNSQATGKGPSLEVKSALVDAATLSNSPRNIPTAPILLLGGSLPNSTWGVPNNVKATFDYIAAHPWIKPLTATDTLTAYPTKEGIHLNSLHTNIPPKQFDTSYYQYKEGHLVASQWSSCLDVDSRDNEIIKQLSANEESQHVFTDSCLQHVCEIDTDMDGHLDCVLSSETTLIVFNQNSGSVKSIFSRSPDGRVHQVIAYPNDIDMDFLQQIAPKLSSNTNSDQFDAKAAFYSGSGDYSHAIKPNQLSFTQNNLENGLIIKTFTLSPNGLIVDFKITDPTSVIVPLTLDPWTRFAPGWGNRYNENSLNDGWQWAISGDISVSVYSDADIFPVAFTDSRHQIIYPENPNLDYPRGHYLPFPMALLQIDGQSNFSVNLIFETE